eukprot:15469008-Alexandrium_andersonii.AAC.1
MIHAVPPSPYPQAKFARRGLPRSPPRSPTVPPRHGTTARRQREVGVAQLGKHTGAALTADS